MNKDNGRSGAVAPSGHQPTASASSGASQSGVPNAVDTLAAMLSVLREGHWTAGVFHVPPARRERESLWSATILSLPGEFPDEASAIAAARSAITAGRVGIRSFIHGPSARPSVHFSLPAKAIDEIGRIASGIEAATADETRSGSAEGESPAPQGETPTLPGSGAA